MPLPPRERVTQRAEIAGFQRGAQVVLNWQMPTRNAAAGSVLNISRIDVYRLIDPLTAPQAITEEEFASRSTQIASVPVTNDDFGLKPFTFIDTVDLAGRPARIRYAVRFVNASGQKAAFSNFFLIEPAASVAAAPASLSTEISQEAITLRWAAPISNVNGTTPANILGYNVYRSPTDKQPAKLLNGAPVAGAEFRDEFFEFGGDYFYFVRTVSSGTGGEQVESGESNIVRVSPRDIFPPGAPAAITLAATPTTISIFFAANPENDIAGYRIYRSTDQSIDQEKWELLTSNLLPTNTYQDTRVESGKTYYYFVTAIDKTGNVSARSEVVMETVP